jgi:ribonuclease G
LSNELIISATQNGSRIALLKDKQLVEFHEELEGSKFVVGDIYLGSVKKVVQGLNAAFIDIGYEKDAFLHYLDLGPQFASLMKFTKLVRGKKITGGRLDKFKSEKDIDKHGKITTQLSKGLLLPVQVVKEPISTKGPRLSSELSIAGRYLVLVPFSNTVSVSKKISSSEERKRLQRIIQSIKPEGFGVIIRTVAESKETAELDRDLRNLVKMWDDGMARMTAANGRDKLIGEISKTSSLLRDLLNESFDNVHVDDKKIFEEVKAYIHTIAPEKDKIVKLYTGKAKIFEHYGIEKQIKSAFGQTVSLRGGGYLIIEHTEALHVIDVNSGNKSTREESQETTAASVNLEAAKEVARQLRLRDMGGIIVVDFIDMRTQEGRKLIYKTMKDEMGLHDRAKHTVLPLSKFGLMQITRERVRPQMNIITKEVCPTCNGTGSITASILITDQIEQHIEHLFVKQNEKELVLALHPFLFAYYTKGIISKRVKMFFKYKRWVKIVKDSSLGITEFHFLNKDGEEIDVAHKGEKITPESLADIKAAAIDGDGRHKHKHKVEISDDDESEEEDEEEVEKPRQHHRRKNDQRGEHRGERKDRGDKTDKGVKDDKDDKADTGEKGDKPENGEQRNDQNRRHGRQQHRQGERRQPQGERKEGERKEGDNQNQNNPNQRRGDNQRRDNQRGDQRRHNNQQKNQQQQNNQQPPVNQDQPVNEEPLNPIIQNQVPVVPPPPVNPATEEAPKNDPRPPDNLTE